MKIYVYGAGENGKKVLNLIQNSYESDVEICGFIDRVKRGEIEGIPVLSFQDVSFANARVIIAIGDYSVAVQVCQLLKKKMCSDIWWFYAEKLIFGRDFFDEQCISCKEWEMGMLRYAEMHIMDACNLNCRGCTHYSPIFENEIPNYESKMQDVRKLKEKVPHIVTFNLMGGEPLLNPELLRYVKGIREILPSSEIHIVTNGLLLLKVDGKILEEIKKQKIKISISEYKPTHKIIKNITKRLEEYEIVYNVRCWQSREKFNKPLVIKKNSDYPNFCISDGCINIWDGKIARCPSLMYIDKFNNYFQTNLPNTGIMNLEDCPSGEELVHKLQEKVPLCNHCIKNPMEWSSCGKEVKLSDFAVEDLGEIGFLKEE